MMEEVQTVEWARQQIAASDGAIFDNDGTLVDSMPAHYRSWSTAVSQHGLSITEAQFYRMAGKPASAVLGTLNNEQERDVSLDVIKKAKAAAMKDEMKKIKAVAPVIELLQYAKALGKPVAVASGSSRVAVVASLRAVGIDADSYFNAVVTAEDVTHGKPNPEAFLLAASRIGVEASKCVGFEDGDPGLQALSSAHMIGIDVRKFTGYPLPAVLKKT